MSGCKKSLNPLFDPDLLTLSSWTICPGQDWFINLKGGETGRINVDSNCGQTPKLLPRAQTDSQENALVKSVVYGVPTWSSSDTNCVSITPTTGNIVLIEKKNASCSATVQFTQTSGTSSTITTNLIINGTSLVVLGSADMMLVNKQTVTGYEDGGSTWLKDCNLNTQTLTLYNAGPDTLSNFSISGLPESVTSVFNNCQNLQADSQCTVTFTPGDINESQTSIIISGTAGTSSIGTIATVTVIGTTQFEPAEYQEGYVYAINCINNNLSEVRVLSKTNDSLNAEWTISGMGGNDTPNQSNGVDNMDYLKTLSSNLSAYPAAQVCANKENETWYLPGICEMGNACVNLQPNMDINLYQLIVLGDLSGNYWSSNSATNTNSSVAGFIPPDGFSLLSVNKDNTTIKTRCARRVIPIALEMDSANTQTQVLCGSGQSTTINVKNSGDFSIKNLRYLNKPEGISVTNTCSNNTINSNSSCQFIFTSNVSNLNTVSIGITGDVPYGKALNALYINLSVLSNGSGLEMPSSFSPNGDGVNDYFVIQGLQCYPDNNLTVYNLWGEIVYRADNYQNNWDGTDMSGRKLPNGTYLVRFADDNTGASLGKSVTLIR